MVEPVADEQPRGTGRELGAGARIGDYTIVRRLARGGMAEVHLAHERGVAGIERFVALKLILPHMADEASFVSMFLNEARVAATLDHPNIAQVLAAGEHGGEPYLVMEYVHGETVHRLLRRASETGPLPLGAALHIVSRACAGLHYAHQRTDLSGQPLGIVHRDVSPSNLMVRFDGTVKLLDFGIAKAASQTTATASGVFKGKSGYMSPEQCADERIDRRSDIFNLGILLYELTTLHRAFFGDNPVAIINKIVHARYEPPANLVPGYPPALAAILKKALAVEPGERYANALDLQLALEDFARERKLAMSSSEVAAYMRAQFGEHPYPSATDLSAIPTEIAPLPSETELHPTVVVTDPALRRPGRSHLWVAAAGLAGTLVLGGWWLNGKSASLRPTEATVADEAQSIPRAPQPEPVTRPAAEPATADATATRGPQTKANAKGEPKAEPEVPAPTTDPEPQPTPTAKRKKRKSSKRKPKSRRRAKAQPKRDADHGPEGFYP